MSAAFKPNGDKSFTFTINFVTWAQKKDLLAMIADHKIFLFRMNCEKVWEINSQSEDTFVSALSFSPNGNILAIAYHSGFICLHDIETSKRLYRCKIKANISCLYWFGNIADQSFSTQGSKIFNDELSEYLPELPPFTNLTGLSVSEEEPEDWENLKRFMTKADFNILLIGTENGVIHFFTYGIAPLANINLNKIINNADIKIETIKDVHLSEDIKNLSVICKIKENENIQTAWLTLNSNSIDKNEEQIQIIAHKVMNLIMCSQYVKSTIVKMHEISESISLQMEMKISKLREAKRKAGGGELVNDFLRLLLYGKKSDEMEEFFSSSQNQAAFKTAGTTLGSQYASLHKLIVKHIHSAAEMVIYEMGDLKIMSNYLSDFEELTFNKNSIIETKKFAFALHHKGNEMAQVITKSAENAKSFLKWLYTAMIRQNEDMANESSRIFHKEIDQVIEFLVDSFSPSEDGEDSNFHLLRIVQYLKSEPLKESLQTKNGEFNYFLKNNIDVLEIDEPFLILPECSLSQICTKFRVSLHELIENAAKTFGEKLSLRNTVMFCCNLPETDIDETNFCQWSIFDEETNITTLFCAYLSRSGTRSKCYVVKQSNILSCLQLNFTSFKGHDDLEIASISHYNDRVMTLLLKKSNLSILVLFDIFDLTNWMIMKNNVIEFSQQNEVNPSDFVGQNEYKVFQGANFNQVYSSGQRDVLALISNMSRKLHMYIIEDDDDIDMLDN